MLFLRSPVCGEKRRDYPQTMIQRLPQFAEHHFALLCAEGGVVCNPSLQDEGGWDFFIQFPTRSRPRRPADLQPTGPEALVQVKSTRGDPLVARIKLSNALKACQSSQPCFLVMVVPDASAARPRVYTRHFWEAEIGRALKSVRLAERAGDQTFNRKTFTVRFAPEDEHSDDLLSWMERCILNEKPSYAAKKAAITSSIGFEDDSATRMSRWKLRSRISSIGIWG